MFLRPLSENVSFAKVWLEGMDSSYEFYFIKHELRYVGAVLDMGQELHWYLLPKYRKKGLLSRAMEMEILPHLFLFKDEQRITIREEAVGRRNYINSQRVAERLGFRRMPNNEYYLSKSDFKGNEGNIGANVKMSKERVQYLKNNYKVAVGLIGKIVDELKMSFNDADDLEHLYSDIKYSAWKLDDLFWKYNDKE